MRAPGRASVVWLALVLTAACASRAPDGIANRFVIRDTGASLTATFDAPSAGHAQAAAKLERAAVPVAPIPKIAPGLTLESETPALGAALAGLAVRETVEGHRRAAAEYWRARVFDKADRHLTAAIALRPRDAMLFEERARMWRDAGAIDRALSDAHHAVFLAPGAAEAHNTLGTVLYALGHVEAARQQFARAVALDPAAAFAQSNLCFVSLAGGALEAARAACDNALRLDPGLEAARRNRERVEAALMARQETDGR